MDIHPPTHPIRSVRDFLLHIFTITCGILIALGLDQVVEKRRDEALAAQARQEFRTEIDTNREKLREAFQDEAALEKGLQAWIDYGEARRRHDTPTAPTAIGGLATRRFARLSSSAWQSAVATQAVAKLDFNQVQAVSAAYTRQQALQVITDHAVEQWIEISGFGDPQTMSDPEWGNGVRVLRIALAYAHTIATNAALLEKDYDRAEAVLR